MRKFNIFLVAVFLGFSSSVSAQVTLVADDFNDGVIDPAKWTTDTQAMFAWSGRNVTEAGGELQLQSKGYLISANQYDPAALGGIRITGTWTAKTGGDVLNIVTRCNATPTINFLNVDRGITCRMGVTVAAGNQIRIERMVGGSSNPPGALLAIQNPVQIDAGDTFAFEVIDTGTSVTFSVQEIGGEGVSASITGFDSTDEVDDFVVFHNREKTFQPYTACLDNVLIESLAPPATPDVLLEALNDVVVDLDFHDGIGNALGKKLLNALADFESGDDVGALEKLTAFINQIKAQAGKKIDEADALSLIESANEIIDLIVSP